MKMNICQMLLLFSALTLGLPSLAMLPVSEPQDVEIQKILHSRVLSPGATVGVPSRVAPTGEHDFAHVMISRFLSADSLAAFPGRDVPDDSRLARAARGCR